MPGAEKRPAPASAAAAAPKKKAKKKKKKVASSEPAAADPAAVATAAAAELDDLFGDLSRGKKAAAAAAVEEAKAAKAAKAKAKERRKEEAVREAGSAVFTSDAHPNTGLNEEGKPSTEHGYHEDPNVHRRTAEGLPVYKYFHLGMDQNDGGTPDCPFDCKCCF